MLEVSSVYVTLLMMRGTSKERGVLVSWTKYCHAMSVLCVLFEYFTCFICTYICGCKCPCVVSIHSVLDILAVGCIFTAALSSLPLHVFHVLFFRCLASIFQQLTLCFTGTNGALNVHQMFFYVFFFLSYTVCKHVHTIHTCILP